MLYLHGRTSVLETTDVTCTLHYFWMVSHIAFAQPLLGPIYTKRQRQCCNNSEMTLAILFSLKSMESLLNGVATYFQVTSLISMWTESQASSKSCHSVDADALSASASPVRHQIGSIVFMVMLGNGSGTDFQASQCIPIQAATLVFPLTLGLFIPLVLLSLSVKKFEKSQVLTFRFNISRKWG